MYTIQECPICYLDFDAERKPYTTPCGHLFCRDCLQEALTRLATCPTCRMPCSHGSVHKIICTYHDNRLKGLAWRDIHRSVQVGSGHEQRKALLGRNLESIIVRERPDMLTTIDVALDVMRLLVKTEKNNQKLESKLETARNLEENLRNEISSLKRSLSNVEHISLADGSSNVAAARPAHSLRDGVYTLALLRLGSVDQTGRDERHSHHSSNSYRGPARGPRNPLSGLERPEVTATENHPRQDEGRRQVVSPGPRQPQQTDRRSHDSSNRNSSYAGQGNAARSITARARPQSMIEPNLVNWLRFPASVNL